MASEGESRGAGDERRLHPVRVELWCPKGPEISWQVVELRGAEALSRPYEFELELLCDDNSVDAEAMLGADAELLLDRDGLTRVFYGVIVELAVDFGPASAADHEGLRARAKLAPALRLLEQEVDTRFFMGQTVIEILAEVLGDGLARYGRSLDVDSRITRRYPARDYCVQFRESSLDFCSRLMEEEGIAYMFAPDHEGLRETMILVDDNAAYASAELLAPGPVPIATHQPEELDHESIQRFDWRSRRQTNRVVARGYNYKLPGRLDEGEAEAFDRRDPEPRAHHLHDEGRQIIDDPVNDPSAEHFTGAELQQRATQAARELQRLQVGAARGRGQANVIGFGAGAVFELLDDAGALAGEELLITEVEHRAQAGGGGGAGGEHSYVNRFECMARAQPFLPARRTARPRVHGVQTGVVVGPAGEEIYTDGLGRVRVRFHRDRHSEDDEQASCWIRVAQIWAGPGYGGLVIPRVGMEVVVAFVDGDPDQPLITGCVYDGVNAPPAALAKDASRSSFKTRSLGGEGFAELRVDDGAGKEQVFVRAQRRMDLRVQGTLLQTSTGNREEVVGHGDAGDPHGDHNVFVHKDVNHRVNHSRYTSVVYDDHLRASRSFERVRERYVTATELAQLNAKRRVVETSELISHKSDRVTLAGSTELTLKAGDRLVLDSNNALQLRVGQSFISIAAEGIDIQGPRLRLNSGGHVGAAGEGSAAEAYDLVFPIEAYAADDGRPRSGAGAGAGAGGERENTVARVDPIAAPPMKPPKPRPKELLDAGKGPREPISLAWLERETWCSVPTPLWTNLDEEGPTQDEFIRLMDAADGSELGYDLTRFELAPALTHQLAVKTVLPREAADGTWEDHRELIATIREVRTAVAIRLRFLSSLPLTPYEEGRARFAVRVDNREVVVSSTIEYTRGWLHYVINLGDTVSSDTGGLIGYGLHGTQDWRYCKAGFDDEGSDTLSYWDGASWVAVPPVWRDSLGTKLHGVAVWREQGVVKTQHGELPWPDPVPEWSKWALDRKDELLRRIEQAIAEFWSGTHELKRDDCLSHEITCCRHGLRCEVRFVEVDAKTPRGIVLAENDSRANASAWPLYLDERTAVHEFGHHLGNPDEYMGASSVDRTVSDDGARVGVDPKSIMGNGQIVRYRHLDGVCAALAKAVQDHLGQSFRFSVVDRLAP